MKRLDNTEVYTIATAAGLFNVIPSRIKNDINGNARFEWLVFHASPADGDYTPVYKYRGQSPYSNYKQSAEFIVNYHIKNTLKKEV